MSASSNVPPSGDFGSLYYSAISNAGSHAASDAAGAALSTRTNTQLGYNFGTLEVGLNLPANTGGFNSILITDAGQTAGTGGPLETQLAAALDPWSLAYAGWTPPGSWQVPDAYLQAAAAARSSNKARATAAALSQSILGGWFKKLFS